MPIAGRKLFNLNQEHTSTNCLFLSNPYNIEVRITSLLELLELLKFNRITISTT